MTALHRNALVGRACRGLPALAALVLWVAALDLVAAAAHADSDTSQNAAVARLRAALLLETLNAELLGHESATATLEEWCGTYGLAAPATVIAERVAAPDKVPSDEQRRQLRVTAAETVRYRRVRLRCGTVILSEADNWYVPGRLTSEMNRLLDTTDTPFGRVVRSLNFRRHTISVTQLWQVLPTGWQRLPAARLESLGEPCLPAYLLEHRAILSLPDGTPFSEVAETYTSNVLAVPGLGLRRCAQ